MDDQRKNGGQYRVRVDKTMYGSINGGGPEIQLHHLQREYLIHKK